MRLTVDLQGIIQVAEWILALPARLARPARAMLRSQRYELLSQNMMEMDGRGIETQSRMRKRKTVWQVDLQPPPPWGQMQGFWSMPAGTRLYIRRRARIDGRRRVLFGTAAVGGNFRFWAEKAQSSAPKG